MQTIVDQAAKTLQTPLVTADELSEFKQVLSGGINTNDNTCVKQYFSYYAKLVN